MGTRSSGDSARWRVRTGDPPDADDLLVLWREEFGGTEDATDWIDRALGDDADVEAFVAVDDADAPVGFAVVGLLDPDVGSQYVHGVMPPSEFPESTGVIHMLAVDEDWSNHLVGSALTERCLDWATGRSPLMLVVLWRRDDHVDSSVLTERYGFDELVRITQYYRASRDHCPDCGDTCSCDATVHAKPLIE